MRWLPWGKSKYNADATSCLIAAVCDKDSTDTDTAAKVKHALDDNADPEAWVRDKVNGGGSSALYEACLRKKTQTARLLIDAGANVNRRSTCYGCHYPLLAATAGLVTADSKQKLDPELIKLLVDHGADVTRKDEGGQTPLMKIIADSDASGDIDLVHLLLNSPTLKDKKSYVNAASGYAKSTALHELMPRLKGRRELGWLRQLLEAGAHLNAVQDDTAHGKKPLYYITHALGEDDEAAQEFLALMKRYGGNLDRTHAHHMNTWTRVLDKLVTHKAHGALLRALLAEGAKPSEQALRELQQYLGMPVAQNERGNVVSLYNTVKELAAAGVALNDVGTHLQFGEYFKGSWIDFTTELTFAKLFQRRISASGVSLSDWLNPDRHTAMMMALTVLNRGETLFAPEHWHSAEERTTAYQLLPVQARRWVKKYYPDLAPLFREEGFPPLATELKKGPLDLDTLAPDGKLSVELLSWWKDINTLSRPQHWKNGERDVIALHTMLPEELSRQVDISHLQRTAPTPRKDSVTVDYLHGSLAAGKGVA